MKHWTAPIVRHALDFMLPPRCGGCGTIVDEVDALCAQCWPEVDWLGEGGCKACGLPLEATDAETCGRCLAKPPIIARSRAAVRYDDLSRSLVLRLKYGRKVALARMMARHMAPLVEPAEDAVLAPVPLHRWRLWQRGFNQSQLIAAQLGRARGLPVLADALVRTRRTRPLKGLTRQQRHREVSRAFAVRRHQRIRERTIILIDDVMTTGSTAEACAKALLAAGARRVELICFARVVAPTTL